MESSEQVFLSRLYCEKFLYSTPDSDMSTGGSKYAEDSRDTIRSWLDSKAWEIIEFGVYKGHKTCYILGGHDSDQVCSVKVEKDELILREKDRPRGASDHDEFYRQEVTVRTPQNRTTPDFLLKKLEELEYKLQG